MFSKQSRGAVHGLNFKGYQGIVGNFVRVSNILMVIKQKPFNKGHWRKAKKQPREWKSDEERSRKVQRESGWSEAQTEKRQHIYNWRPWRRRTK